LPQPEIYWEGASGKTYAYWIYPIGTTFLDQPGNYIYARQSSPGRWVPAYVGQTASLADRLADHEKEGCALRHGASHIHCHTTPGGEAVRLAEESDLIAKWRPPCNG